MPELKKWVKFNYENIRNGLVLMAWGFFKKLVIADRLAEYVNVVYNRPSEYDGLPTLLATYFFSFQIYCDFSGYSDIAIGASLVLGVRLMTNFRQPYFSKNIGEFWNRWHISLSTWFRDYLYIPLGGNRVVTSRLFFNVLIVFLISGIWHGANWTFAIWGLLHGIYLVITIVSRSFSSRISSAITGDKIFSLKSFFQIFLTYHLVLFGWIFFRSATLNDALLIFDNIISRFSFNTPFNLFRNSIDFGISLSCIGMLLAVEYLQQTFDLNQKMEKLHYLLKWILLGALLFSIFTLGKFEGTDFLYFQF